MAQMPFTRANRATPCACVITNSITKICSSASNEAHALGKKFYVVVNIAPHNAKLKTFIRDLKPVVEMGPDALIMSDRG
ncbi:protease [Klebsiella michiganensis]|uniref:Protease n=1 Tax=Klebsiella michiganensis TaxID=1134687 RepID=A0A7H4PQ22_9ENTR|nr:protease [Klebsiella michiganensis]